ncbi:histone-lysine N-methyltransferase SETMAR-like [Amphiura filiformis]|uniref:histone-lysine N-methyltransferase SETMAR-like n=1 Tax=Amphiura filiformis TaxID=82378 RepID=UPI003B221018
MVSTLGDTSPRYSTIKKRAAEFKRGRESLEDDPRSGSTRSSTTSDQVDAIRRIVLKDRHLTTQQIANKMRISYGSVKSVLNDTLGMSKLSARWVPRIRTPDQKFVRHDLSKELLARFQTDPDYFYSRIVTQDETWVHHFEPE